MRLSEERAYTSRPRPLEFRPEVRSYTRVATYHFTVKIVSRTHGRSVVGAAAYRSGTRLKENSTQLTYDYTRKHGVEHTEILAPNNAPSWVFDRSQLWNTVDQVEKRKDAQLARDMEIALPIELDNNAQVELLRDFVRHEFVAKGMVADCAIHRDNPNNPHAHVLLTLRHIGPKGFGLKERSWNERSQLLDWRLAWAETTNKHLAKAGLSARIDHRTLEAQGLDLIPTRKIGVSLERQKSDRLPPRIAERVAEHRAIAAENGSNIIADPRIATKALTHYNSAFTERDIARFLHTRTDGAEQFNEAYLKVTTSLSRRPRSYMEEIDAMQQQGAEKWREKQIAREKGASSEPQYPPRERPGMEDDLEL